MRATVGSSHGRRRRAVGAFALTAVLMSAGCVSTNEIGGSNNPTPTTAPIEPVFGTVGADVTYQGVMVTVVDVTAFDQSPSGTPRIKVVMRAENLSSSVQRNPDVELRCDETSNVGDWFLGSTWEPNVLLPVNAVSQGEVIVGFPLKGDNPEYPVVTCTAAKLRLTLIDAQTKAPELVDYPLDESLITEAIRRPRGVNLPLPRSGS